MSRHVLRPGLRQAMRLAEPVAAAPVGDWWEGNGTIPSANVIVYNESPSPPDLYENDFDALTGAWTVAIRATWNGNNEVLFDAQTGRVLIRWTGIYLASDTGITLLNNGVDTVYLLISDGSNVQGYRNTSTYGASTASTNDIGGRVNFGSYNYTASTWTGAMPAYALYDIALSSAQRSALVSAMAAL